MDKSYKIKLESNILEKKLNKQLLINCLAKFDNRANKLSAIMGNFKNCKSERVNIGTNEELLGLIEYRKPFIKVLCKSYSLSLENIKFEITATLQDKKKIKNIPTFDTIEKIRQIIVDGDYLTV